VRLLLASARGRKAEMVNAANSDKDTPLHWVASEGHIEVVKILLAEGADVNACNKDQNTPLLVACEAGQDEAALALARRGANLGVEDSEGANVATLAPKLVSALRAIKQGDAYL